MTTFTKLKIVPFSAHDLASMDHWRTTYQRGYLLDKSNYDGLDEKIQCEKFLMFTKLGRGTYYNIKFQSTLKNIYI